MRSLRTMGKVRVFSKLVLHIYFDYKAAFKVSNLQVDRTLNFFFGPRVELRFWSAALSNFLFKI